MTSLALAFPPANGIRWSQQWKQWLLTWPAAQRLRFASCPTFAPFSNTPRCGTTVSWLSSMLMASTQLSTSEVSLSQTLLTTPATFMLSSWTKAAPLPLSMLSSAQCGCKTSNSCTSTTTVLTPLPSNCPWLYLSMLCLALPSTPLNLLQLPQSQCPKTLPQHMFWLRI